MTELQVSGMTCNNCARHVTEAIQSVASVRSATVTLSSNRASVRWADESSADIPAVLKAIKAAGYQAKAVQADQRKSKLQHWHLNLWLGGVVTAVLMIGEWAAGLGMERWFQWMSFVLAAVVQFVAGAQFYQGAWRQLKIKSANMDTLVALGSTTAFAYSAWALLTNHGGHLYFMEAAAIITLISIGHWVEAKVSDRASGALKELLQLAPQTARRIVSTTSMKPNADQSGDILGLRGQAKRDPAFDLQLKPGTSPKAPSPLRFASAVQNETEVPVADLKVGDIVALRPGDHIPTDGEVIDGDSSVNEAMLTGESVPADKSRGSKLFAGTLNTNGRLIMRVTATGEATALAHIIAAVQRAQTSRADIQRLGDKVSSVFVPIVVTIALAAGLWWGFAPDSARHIHDALSTFLWHAHPPTGIAAGFIIAAAVLIVACPCAMGLATPAAIMASANAAAKRGILIRDGVALEKAGTITAIIFDKTGTLTVGKPEVVKTWEADQSRAGVSPALSASQSRGAGETPALLSLAAALARHSTHPISQAVAAFVRTREDSAARSRDAVTVEKWKEIRGAGVEGNIQHSTFNYQQPTPGVQSSTLNPQPSTVLARLGSLNWLRESGVDLAAGESFVTEWSAQGATIVGLSAEKSLLGLFAVKDTLKPGATDVVEQLKRQGLKSYLLTGDNKLTAASIAKQTGIAAENVFAEVRPEQKAEFVKRLQQQGERVAFVGDGINDAPALEQADLGIAVSRASDVAREAADIILLKSEIEAVPEALGLARATLRTIKQNLFWAFFYNAAGVPLAALGFMSPILCAAAMGLSDLIVIGNALRLMRRRGGT